MEMRRFIDMSNEFASVAHAILAKQESSASRVVLLEQTYRELDTLSVNQNELFKHALRCVQHGLYKAAHVMGWAALFDFVEQILEKDSFGKINRVRPKWNVQSLSELREGYPEFQIIEAMKEARIISKNDAKALHGLLHRRNECAHPGDYSPDLNASLGYIAEILERLRLLRQRNP